MARENIMLAYGLHSKDERGNFTIQVEPVILSHMFVNEVSLENARHVVYRDYYNSKDYYRSEYQWALFKDPRWRERENYIRAYGNDSSIPQWNLTDILDHYPMLECNEQGQMMISFFESELKGMINNRTRMRVGRYLTKYHPQLSKDEVTNLVSVIDAAGEVRFASTGDDIERVYNNGPSSCMSHEIDDYHTGGLHPVRVYASPDLQLAYLSPSDITNDKFRASSRALVWPEKKLYSRIYGDCLRMEAGLKKLGYTDGLLIGARILRIPCKSGFLMPYIDNNSRVYEPKVDADLYFTIGSGHKYVFDACMQNGLSYDVDDDYEDDDYDNYEDDYVEDAA